MTYHPLSRRQILKGMSASLGVLALRGFSVQAAAPLHFTHGVASGDPLSDRVILWTRALPGGGAHSEVEVRWEVAADEGFNRIVTWGSTRSTVDRDYTVKVDVVGLEPGETYFYRFSGEGVTSMVGQTRTLPAGDVEEFRLGVASCSNYPQGYFNAYRDMADAELDLVVHLGDYIYEYADGIYASKFALEKLDRHVKPDHETVALEDYRMRYGLYRSDADLQAVHARHPFVCVWDDHELANNTWREGAENHDSSEGEFSVRMRQARKAYHEWLPIRESDEGDQAPIYRSFPIGNLADLVMLDTRLHGRDRGLDYSHDMPVHMATFHVTGEGEGVQVDEATAQSLPADEIKRLPLPFDISSGSPVAVTDYSKIAYLIPGSLPPELRYLPDTKSFKTSPLNDSSRSILGADQEAWLDRQLQASKARGATWQVLGQQVLVGKLGVPVLPADAVKVENPPQRLQTFLDNMAALAAAELPLNLDAWDGYPVARDRLFSDLINHASNPVVLAGDTHNAWAFNLSDSDGRAVGVEIGAPGISSPGLESIIPAEPDVLKQALMDCSSEIVQADTVHRGWAEIALTPAAATSEFHYVSTVLDKDYTVESSQVLRCAAGDRAFS
ncbi:MAG: alkaline phosphatase D family protein [Halioglobus sp.]